MPPGPFFSLRLRNGHDAASIRALKARLAAVAAEHGFYTTAGTLAGRGNITTLLEAIADGRLVVVRPDDVRHNGAEGDEHGKA